MRKKEVLLIHSLVFSHRAKKDWKGLPRDIRKTISDFILELILESHQTDRLEKVRSDPGKRKGRKGDWRVIYSINPPEFYVHRIAHGHSGYRS